MNGLVKMHKMKVLFEQNGGKHKNVTIFVTFLLILNKTIKTIAQQFHYLEDLLSFLL